MSNDKPEISLERLSKLPVPVSVRVCSRSMKLEQFLDWTEGTVLAFDQSVSSPLQMQIGNRDFGEGRAVKLGTSLGIRIQRIDGASNSKKSA